MTTNHRRFIVLALRSLRGADLTLFSYAEQGHLDDLEGAFAAARCLVRSLRAERKRRKLV